MLRRNVDDQCNSLKMSISHVAFNSVHNTLELIIMRGRRGRNCMVFNATFNNISVISWSVLLEEETGENHRPVTQICH
jgi:hypothetical protein